MFLTHYFFYDFLQKLAPVGFLNLIPPPNDHNFKNHSPNIRYIFCRTKIFWKFFPILYNEHKCKYNLSFVFLKWKKAYDFSKVRSYKNQRRKWSILTCWSNLLEWLCKNSPWWSPKDKKNFCISKSLYQPLCNGPSVNVMNRPFVNVLHYQYVAIFLIKLGLYSVYLS